MAFCSEDGAERSEPEGLVIWDGDAVTARCLRLENHVTALLMNPSVPEGSLQLAGQITPG